MSSYFQERKRCTLYGVRDTNRFMHLSPKYIVGNNIFFTTSSKEELMNLVEKLQKMNEGRLDCNLYQGDITRQPQVNEYEDTLEHDEFYKISIEKKKLDFDVLLEDEIAAASDAHILGKLDGLKLNNNSSTSSNPRKKRNKKKIQKVKGIARRGD